MYHSSWTLNASRRNSRLAGVVVLLAALLVTQGAWAAKKRVVVLGFSGPQAGKAEAAVVTAVKKKSERPARIRSHER